MNQQLRIKDIIGNWKLEIGNSSMGQALISLLFFMIIAITITSAAIIMIFTNSLSASAAQQGDVSYAAAENGIENALLRLLRDPTYKGETLPSNGGNATVQIVGNDPYTITSDGYVNSYKRTIQVVASYTTGQLTISSWKEIF